MITPIEFANRYLQPYKIRGSEIIPKYCPFCNGGNNHDKETFALNMDKLTYNCLRGSCGESGHFTELLKLKGEDYMPEYERRMQPRKSYKKPKTKLEKPKTQVEKYLATRKISRSTWEKRKVSESNGNIVFPYYENGELVLVKFRPARKVQKGEKKAWREEGGKPVFWGIDDTTHTKPLVIVEGEFDALSLDEAGIENVVSVPSGTQDLQCIDNNWEWLNKFQKVILWVDNDEAGHELEEKLINILGAWRCYVVRSERKDANEVLFFDGPGKVKELVQNAKEVPISGLIRLRDVKRLDYSQIEKVQSGFKGLDKILGGFMMGEVTVWTGINSSGKSTLLGQVLLNILDQNYKVWAYSGELTKEIFRYWLDIQASGPDNLEKKFDEIKQEFVPKLKPDIIRKIENWYGDNFFLFDGIEGATDKQILEMMEYTFKRYNCKIFMIDNLMTTFFTDDERDFYRQQSNFVRRIKSFAKQYAVHVHLVAHPRKTTGRLNKMDVAGSGDITNLADNVLAVHRLSEEEKEKEIYKDFNNLLMVFKNRMNGLQEVEIRLKFDLFSRRFYQEHDEPSTKQYGWDKPDWVQEAMVMEVSTL